MKISISVFVLTVLALLLWAFLSHSRYQETTVYEQRGKYSCQTLYRIDRLTGQCWKLTDGKWEEVEEPRPVATRGRLVVLAISVCSVSLLGGLFGFAHRVVVKSRERAAIQAKEQERKTEEYLALCREQGISSPMTESSGNGETSAPRDSR